jgi:predicted permease
VLGTLAALSPVLAGLAGGVALRRTGVAEATHGRFLLLVNLYLCMPALALLSLASIRLTPSLAVFPGAAAVMVGVGYAVGRARGRGLPPAERSVVLMGLMVVNCAFALPFVEALHGAAGVTRLMAFDVVNNFLVLTVVHALAAGASPLREARRSPFVQVLRTPPLHALLVGIGLNLTGTPLPSSAEQVLQPFAAASPVLIALGTGVLYAPSSATLRRAGALAAVRIAVGLSVALLVVVLLGLDGVDRDVLLLLGAAPLGFVIVTFSAHNRLDTDLAADALALSLGASVVLSLALSLGFSPR